MKDIVIINNSINNVMNSYITDNGYQDSVLFESRVMISSNSVMFTMMMKQGLFKVEPFKAVFPGSFLEQCDEDQAVKMICTMFKEVIQQCNNLSQKEVVDVKFTAAANK